MGHKLLYSTLHYKNHQSSALATGTFNLTFKVWQSLTEIDSAKMKWMNSRSRILSDAAAELPFNFNSKLQWLPICCQCVCRYSYLYLTDTHTCLLWVLKLAAGQLAFLNPMIARSRCMPCQSADLKRGHHISTCLVLCSISLPSSQSFQMVLHN